MKIKVKDLKIRKTWVKNPGTKKMEKSKKDKIRHQRRRFKQHGVNDE